MNRIDDRFQKLKNIGKKALIAFVTAGDPDLSTTGEIVSEMVKQGADLIELGIPFSDPIAEGPVIQAANARALSKGTKLKDIMDAVVKMRKEVTVPIVYLLYFNSILKYGTERFFKECLACGVDGVIIPDLPFEEKAEIENIAAQAGVIIITLVSPVSQERTIEIARNAKGFLYCVSSLGVTGVRNDFSTDFEAFFSYINKATNIPKALGFGISTPEHIRSLKKYCDGLIIGSAIVKIIEKSKDPKEAVVKVGSYIKELRSALD
jgi:tryptophan synthase, alpha subunit